MKVWDFFLIPFVSVVRGIVNYCVVYKGWGTSLSNQINYPDYNLFLSLFVGVAHDNDLKSSEKWWELAVKKSLEPHFLPQNGLSRIQEVIGYPRQ
jgi:hypothetical protein